MKHTGLVISGIFLLIWSSTAHVLLGETLKLFSLILGFVMVMGSIFIGSSFRKEQLVFLITSLAVFIFLIFLGYVRHQDVFRAQNIIFGIICLGLINAGYALGQVSQFSIRLNEMLPASYSLLTIATAVQFIKTQQLMDIDGRSLAFELSPVGLAFIETLLLIFLVFVFLSAKWFINKLLCLVAITACAGVILSTLSRGAILYLVLLAILLSTPYLRKLAFKAAFRGIIVVLVAAFALNLIVERIPVLAVKKEALITRIGRLQSYFSSDTRMTDRSSEIRASFYDDFFTGWDHYTWGKYRYSPYPHNQFLEIYSRWGVFGLPILLFSVLMLFKSLRIFMMYRSGEVPFLMMINSFFIFSYMQSMSSLSLEMNRMMWLGFGFVLAVRLNSIKETAGNSSDIKLNVRII